MNQITNRKMECLENMPPGRRTLLEQQLLKRAASKAPRRSSETSKAQGPVPLSFAQESLWFFDQLEPNSPLYNMPYALRLRGALNVSALRKALSRIVSRHDSLRTHITVVSGRPMQVTAAATDIDMPVIDLSPFSNADSEREAKRRMDEFAGAPFDLTRDLLLRAELLRLREDEHLLLLSLHHIAGDLWSLGILYQELAAFYGAECAGKAVSLPTLEMQYTEFALRQREQFCGERARQQIAYWKKQLSGELPVLELPTDRPRLARQTFRGAKRYFTYPTGLLAALKELGRRENVTVYTILLAAFQILLHRYSRQEDLLVGSSIGGRSGLETEKLIGYFLSIVVLRADLSGEPTFLEFLQRVRTVVLGAFANQEAPLARLTEEIKTPRTSGRNPFFQVFFQFLAQLPPLPQFPGLNVESMPLETHTAKFDLGLSVAENSDGLTGDLEYNTDLYDPGSIERLLGHYLTLLESIAINPRQKIQDLSWLRPEEESQLLSGWNQTETEFSPEATIVSLFEAQVTSTPQAVAVTFADQQLTYAELNRQANRLAHRLRKMGAGPGMLAGICMFRSLEMVVAILGILKAGAAYVPFDPEYPKGRLRFMIDDARASIVLVQQSLKPLMPEGQNTICLDTPDPDMPVEIGNPPLVAHPENLAYVLYTSGSTGNPKGAMISHAAICNHTFWMQKQFPLLPTDRVLQKTAFSFDASVWEFLSPLTNGAKLVMAEPEAHRDSSQLVETIIREQITILQLVPSQLAASLAESRFRECRSLKHLFCGGEALSAELVNRCTTLLPGIKIVNLYGPTEAAIDSTFHVCGHGDRGSAVPIGKPIANARVYVLDKQLRPVPVGVPGELYIGGRGLARGYWRQEELTREKFIPNPFDNRQSRLYKTGDLVRYLAQGDLEFLGRIDHQVKIRGFRIELGEIEAVLLQQPTVREAVVAPHNGPDGGGRLVAYLTLKSKSAVEMPDIRDALKQMLPDYMVPSAFVLLDALPLLPNGKVNRRALPAPDFQADAVFVAPRSSLEADLAQIWRDILKLQQVGIHDDFFELGGHSLLAAQVVARTRSLTQAEINLRNLFESPTIALLSARIEKSGPPTAVPTITPLSRKTATA